MTKKLSINESEEFVYVPLEKVYTSYDLGCSAALVTAGFVLDTLDKTNPRKVQFIFYREAGVKKVVDEYWADRLEVKARAFFDNIKMLKNRIYSE